MPSDHSNSWASEVPLDYGEYELSEELRGIDELGAEVSRLNSADQAAFAEQSDIPRQPVTIQTARLGISEASELI